MITGSPGCAVISLSELQHTADPLRGWRLGGGGVQRLPPPALAVLSMEEAQTPHWGAAEGNSLGRVEGTHAELGMSEV